MKKFVIVGVLIVLLMGCVEKEMPVDKPESSVEVIKKEAISKNALEEEKEEPLEGEILFSSERGGDRDLYIMDVKTKKVRLLLNLPSKEGHGDFAPDGYRIVFFSDLNGNRDLYTIDLRDDDLKMTRLTHSKGSDHLPDWSPDGQYITFESTRDGNSEIYLMKSDGSQQVRITNNNRIDKQPKFSSEGETIGFTTVINGSQHYATVALSDILDDAKENTITVYETENIGYIDYSSDGKQIAYHGKVSGKPQIFISNLSLNKPKKLSNPDRYTNWIPVFSPDNNWIAYNKEGSFGSGDIYITKTDGTSTIQLTDTSTSEWGPDWRPAINNKIYYDSNIDGDRELYYYDMRTKEITQITHNDFQDGLPSLSTCGTKILYFSDSDGDDELYIYNHLDKSTLKLTDNAYNDRAAVFSKNDDFIVFCSDRDGDLELYIMNTDGSQVTQLTDNGKKDFWPSISPDNKYVFYTSFKHTQDTYSIALKDWQIKEVFESELVKKNCSRAEFSMKGDKIAYSTKINGHWQIAISNLSDLEEEILTTANKNHWVPTWINDQMLIFSREYGYKAAIVKLNIDTLEETQILRPDAQNWRPIVH